MESRASSMEIRLLGPIGLRIDDREVEIGGPRQRALLAVLALRHGRVVPADELIDELWAGEPTDAADTTLRSYVSRLRRPLEGIASIDRTGHGYSLDLPPESVDAHVFERLVREGGEALAAGSARRARGLLGEALALWRGRPFGEVGSEGALATAANRLDEMRLLAIEQRAEADLELGRAAEIVDELEGLVGAHPFRERLWRHLMLALYRAGRQADALAAYHRARRALDEELGIEPGEELRELEAAILRQDVPGAAGEAEGEVAHNLPAALSSFVGRTGELREVSELLTEHRLVTLTGIGGVGKTRLAIEAARKSLDRHPDGTFLVDLARIVDPAHVTSALAAALDVQQQGRQSPADALIGFLDRRRILLVLDNCEHLAATVARLVEALLAGAAQLRILATSREVLGVPGEVDYAVPPLGLPRTDDPAAARASDAVQLFLERVREARPDVAQSDGALAVAAQICRDLDGLPLAMELAAARARALSLSDISRHIEDRFRFLVSWRSLSPARHRTLREAMDWSHALLAPEERDLLARVSVFPGGFTLDAAEAVAADAGSTLDALQRLVEASLVNVDTTTEPTRYRLLETVRQYAAEQLGDGRVEAEKALTTWVLDLVTSIVPDSTRPMPPDAYARFDVELDNIRAALREAATHSDPAAELTIGSLIWRYWWVRGLLVEGRSVSEAAIRRWGVVDSVAGARTFRAAASLTWAVGDFDDAAGLARVALEIAERIGDATEKMSALNVLSVIARAKGDPEQAARHTEQSLQLARAAGNAELVSMYSGNLGSFYIDLGRHDEARAIFLAVLEYRNAQGPSEHAAVAHLNLGQLDLEAGDLGAAERHFHDALDMFTTAGFKIRMANSMHGLAAVEARSGRSEAGARRLGAAAALIGETGWATGDSPLERAAVEAARAALGDAAFERLFNEGLREA